MENNHVKESPKPSRGGGRPFPPNNNANPHGAPEKENTYARLIREVGEQQSAKDAVKTRKLVAIDQQWTKAEAGELPSLNWLADREEGKPMQKSETDITSGGEKISGFVVDFIQPHVQTKDTTTSGIQ